MRRVLTKGLQRLQENVYSDNYEIKLFLTGGVLMVYWSLFVFSLLLFLALLPESAQAVPFASSNHPIPHKR